MANREQSAEEVFGAALDLPPERRSAYLIQACRESPELRTLVEGLLVDYQRMGSFLDEPLVAPSNGSTAPTSPFGRVLAPGDRLGRYSIIEPLGAGGMGAVYRARDEKLENRPFGPIPASSLRGVPIQSERQTQAGPGTRHLPRTCSYR